MNWWQYRWYSAVRASLLHQFNLRVTFLLLIRPITVLLCATLQLLTLWRSVDVLALRELLDNAPLPSILKLIICQLSKVLSNNAVARQQFAVSGGLQKIVDVQAEPGSALGTVYRDRMLSRFAVVGHSCRMLLCSYLQFFWMTWLFDLDWLDICS